jgi:hypothetical protein
MLAAATTDEQSILGPLSVRSRSTIQSRLRRPDTHVASNGWSARLYWQWILYNSVAFVVVLTAVAVLSWISADVLHLSLTNRNKLVALLVATLGAILFGGVLGALQWLVIRQRVPVERKRWIVANVGPALLGWLFVIMPAVISAQDSNTSVSGAYLLAASQTLALGPLLACRRRASYAGTLAAGPGGSPPTSSLGSSSTSCSTCCHSGSTRSTSLAATAPSRRCT